MEPPHAEMPGASAVISYTVPDRFHLWPWIWSLPEMRVTYTNWRNEHVLYNTLCKMRIEMGGHHPVTPYQGPRAAGPDMWVTTPSSYVALPLICTSSTLPTDRSSHPCLPHSTFALFSDARRYPRFGARPSPFLSRCTQTKRRVCVVRPCRMWACGVPYISATLAHKRKYIY